MSRSQLANLIFSSDLSTSDEADEDKGRGVGMALVLETAKKLGGAISIKTNQVIGTTFIVNFPKGLIKEKNLAA